MLHRVDVIEDLPVKRFFAFVHRLPHYQGAMRNIAMREVAERQPDPEPMVSGSGAVDGRQNDDVVATSVDLMAVHPVWGIGSFSKAPLEAET